MNYQYPAGIDCVWLASDSTGSLAAFVTGGEGPIPRTVLINELVQLEDVEMAICDLDVTTGAQMLVAIPRPDDFIDMARRGFYVFDWQDVNRIGRDQTRVYEKVAVPTSPIKLESLPNALRCLAERTKITSLLFAEESKVDAQVLFECERPER